MSEQGGGGGSDLCYVCCSQCRFVGEVERIDELEGATVFERKVVRTGEKRKRAPKGDPGDIDGYMGELTTHTS